MNTQTQQPVNVLAALDRSIATDANNNPEWATEMRAARAAVAELVEAANEMQAQPMPLLNATMAATKRLQAAIANMGAA